MNDKLDVKWTSDKKLSINNNEFVSYWPLNKPLHIKPKGNYVQIYYGDKLLISFENNRDGVDEMLVFYCELSDTTIYRKELCGKGDKDE